MLTLTAAAVSGQIQETAVDATRDLRTRESGNICVQSRSEDTLARWGC